MSGRPKVPSSIQILKGNPGRRPLNSREPDVAPIKTLPRPPKFLGKIGAAKYRSKGRELINAGVLTELDMDQLGRFCKWHEVYCKASSKLNLDRVGDQASTNLLNVCSMASKAMRQIESEFGMSPASRSRVRVSNPKQMSFLDDLDSLLDDQALNDDDPQVSASHGLSASAKAATRVL